MRYRTRFLLVALVTAALVLPMIGCTLIGYGIGSMADAKKPLKKEVPGWGWREIKHGEQLTVIRMNGLVDSGRFVTLQEQERSEYAARFTEHAESIPGFPFPGDTITIKSLKGDSMTGMLVGYDQRYGYDPSVPAGKRAAGESGPTYLSGVVVFQSENVEKPRRIDCRLIAEVRRTDGQAASGDSLMHAISGRRLPCLSSLIVQKTAATVTIPVDEIEQLWAKNHPRGKTTGLVIGLTIDAALITMAIIVASMDFSMGGWSSSSGGDGAYSCPFVYAYDGETYHRQAEVFGGAIFKGAQRTDWVTLDSLRSVDGVCRLRITNELDETQYVDELSLLAVDHPVGTTVVPSFDGRLHVLGSPVVPHSAKSDNGANQLDALRETDGRMWISNPFGRDASQPRQVRDGLELSFPLDSGARSATLVVRGRNTRWSAEMLAEVLRLQGDSLASWYRMLNDSNRERERLARAMIREGMLIVKVWTDGTWRDAGMIWDVGPAVARDVAVTIGITPGDESTLRVRLESTAGFWMIDRATVYYDDRAPASVTKLTAFRASDEAGGDRRAELRATDGDYYTMPDTSNRSDVEFRVPVAKPGLKRSYVVCCNGYYTIHVQGHGAPDPQLMARLLDEPGAYGRYTLELLDRKVREAMVSRDTGVNR